MTALLIAGLAAGAGLGVLLTVAGLSGRNLLPDTGGALRVSTGRGLTRLAVAVVVALAVAMFTGWLVGGILAGVAGWTLPLMLGGRAARQDAIAKTEAIASWTEMIRDSIVAASGLEEAITATASVAPAPVGNEVVGLVRRLDHQRLPDALVAFGADLEHPSGDLVVAALVIASRLEASDLSNLLSRLADAARGEARMRIRVDVGRTRVRTATKVIVGVVIAAVAFLAIGNRGYLDVYDEPSGQLVLGLVGGIFFLGGWLLTRMAAIEMPERFTARVVSPGVGT
jgi:Flp pilus assembly protein TadB